MEDKKIKKTINYLCRLSISLILLFHSGPYIKQHAQAFFEDQVKYKLKHYWYPMLSDPSPEKRFQSARVFLTYPEWSLPLLRNSIMNLDPENVPWQIAMLIGMLGDSTDIPHLLKIWKDLGMYENSSIWLINDDNFEKFYLDNKSVEKLEISKQLPNIINININLHQKIIVYTDFRDSSPKQRVLYKNLYTDDKIFEKDLAHLVITNGPIEDGFYSEIVSFILTVEKYDVDLSKLSVTFDGNTVVINYLDTVIEAGKAVDLSRKGSVVGYALEKGDCKGRITIFDGSDENIETLFNCEI